MTLSRLNAVALIMVAVSLSWLVVRMYAELGKVRSLLDQSKRRESELGREE